MNPGKVSLPLEKDLIDVLDCNGLRTGEKLQRKEIHELGKWHRAVHFYLFDSENNILLQKRSNFVDHYPNMLSISLTGHIDAGEGSFQALKREIEEELSLNSEKMDIQFLFSFKREAVLNPKYIDRQFNDVYMCKTDFNLKDLKKDESETAQFILVSLKKFIKMAESNDSELVPAYSDSLKDVLYFIKK